MSESTTQPVYDPSKSYTWTADSEFILRGGEYGFIFNSIMKEEEELRRKLSIIELLKNKLKEAVEAGVAKENVPAAPS